MTFPIPNLIAPARPWVRHERIGDCDLYLGDCLSVMPALGPVDAVVTDPPYEDNMHANNRGVKVFGSKRAKREGRDPSPEQVNFSSISGIRQSAAQYFAALSGGWLIVFCTPEGVAPWRDVLVNSGAKYKRACVWVKPDSAPQFNGQCPANGVEMFVSAWAGDGASFWNGGGRRNVWTFACNPSDRHGFHKTEKPISLMLAILSDFTQDECCILDPFMGSGTTLVACAKLGRKGIGIELDPGYFDIACKRVEEAYRQPDLFVKAPSNPPVQGGLDL